jgi:hypothetical protein
MVAVSTSSLHSKHGRFIIRSPIADQVTRYVKTNILSDETFNHVSSVGVEFAQAEDAAQCLLRSLSDRTINGHSLFVSGRKWASSGYIDLDLEDYPSNTLIHEIQEGQIKSAPAELGLFL